MSSLPVAPSQRFTRARPCPICGGYDSASRGLGMRCAGYLSHDGRIAYCTREERAGALAPRDTAAGPTYAHRLDRACNCREAHDTADAPALRVMAAGTRQPRQALRPHRGPLPKTYQGATFNEAYHYRDASGRRLYTVARYVYPLQPGEAKPDKTFPQFHWVDDGNTWDWGLGEAQRVLYRLPELMAALSARPVFVVEGERKADALAGLGLVATTCSEGAGKWSNTAGRQGALRGRHIVILPDNDERGGEHARQIAADLRGVAASVRIVALPDLPPKGDVIDWLAAGGTALLLYELVIGTPAEGVSSVGYGNGETSGEKDSAGHTMGTSAALREREEALRLANARRRALEEQDAWQRACAANPHLGATTKLIAVALREELTRAKVGDGGELKVYLPALAERAGVSDQTASDALKRLAECGAIVRRVEAQIGAGGRKVSRVTVSPTVLFAQPAKFVPPTPRNHGGKRCPHCGGSRLIVDQTITCAECGAVLKRERRTVDGDAMDSPAQQEAQGSQLDCLIPEGGEMHAPGPHAQPDCAEHVPRRASAPQHVGFLESYLAELEAKGITGDRAVRMALRAKGVRPDELEQAQKGA